MRLLFSVLLAVVFAWPSAWAKLPKKLPKTPKLPTMSGAASVRVRVNLPKIFNKLPESVLRKYGGLLHESHLEGRISARAYPSLSRHNDWLAAQSLNRFVRLEEDFLARQHEIAANIQSMVTPKVAYKEFLPQNIDVLYIGEVHQEARVQEEIANLINSLKDAYPNRPIYLASESVPSAAGQEFSADGLIRTREALQARLLDEAELLGLDEAEVLVSLPVVEAALAAEIPVLGLESEEALLEFAKTEKGEWPTAEQYEQVVTSFAGMEFRNKNFARLINGLRMYDPEALVVFYGGIDHAAYHRMSALAEMVTGRPFVVQVTVPGALWQTHPLYKNFRESEAVRLEFQKNPSARLVEWWKEPGDYNRILGNDLTVIVHEE